MSPGIARPVRWTVLAAAFAAVVIVAFGLCEALGWPFLAASMQRWVGDTLQRRVSLSADPAMPPKAMIRLLGGIEVTAPYLEVGAPAWSAAPHTLVARDARLSLGYLDLWRAGRGQPLHVRGLQAQRLDAHVERRSDGRASWQFGRGTEVPDTAELPSRRPTFGHLQVDSGTVAYLDAMTAVDVQARFSLVDGPNAPTEVIGTPGLRQGLQVTARGTYRQQPLTLEAQVAGVLPLLGDQAAVVAVPVSVDAHIGRARLSFKGTATDALRLSALQGTFSVQGPSLAAVGDPLGVTLPTTAPFRAEGRLARQGRVWSTVLDEVRIGASRLAGAFTYDPQPRVPVLAGRLTGARLQLADLGPALGVPVRTAAAPAASAASRSTARPGRTLPDREFDLPALRAMNATVLVAIDIVDLGSGLLEPLKPLRALLVLTDGVLVLRDLDARTGQGHLGGRLQFDGRAAQAQWTADLHWDGVRLERWVHQARAANVPPYATGALTGRARVAGQGKSTAAILGSLQGEVRLQVVNGTISHLVVEAAGLDIAQGLGVLFKGDDALPILCTVAHLTAERGVLRPRVMVLDTTDSTLWVDGSMSLANEAIDLRVMVSPKDFSPLTLRTPIHLRGTFADPSVSVDKGKFGTRLGASALLAFINPLVALIPLMDVGTSDEAKRSVDQCRALTGRKAGLPALPAPDKGARSAPRPVAAAPVR
ncbi:AsmA family protein [Ideonella sp. A 288]|uniref:AsmA family protein n=1 Tax=Ideonella sp. A 288 TaxID=1962181 RepID=UPI0011857BAE|nr:AsmA family protein [Ideonella sp. A 288]